MPSTIMCRRSSSLTNLFESFHLSQKGRSASHQTRAGTIKQTTLLFAPIIGILEHVLCDHGGGTVQHSSRPSTLLALTQNFGFDGRMSFTARHLKLCTQLRSTNNTARVVMSRHIRHRSGLECSTTPSAVTDHSRRTSRWCRKLPTCATSHDRADLR